MSAQSFSQCQITLQPGPNEGKDARVFSLNCSAPYAVANGPCESSNFGNDSWLTADDWTYMGDQASSGTFLEFNLDSLAAEGCTVSDAQLFLYTTGVSNHFHCGSGSTIVSCNDNSININRVTSAWDEQTVTYANQPSIANAVPGQDVVYVGNEADPYVTYSIDITDMVNFWLANPVINYGMYLYPSLPNYYERVMFASSDHSDPAKRPKLVLTTQCQNSCANVISGTVYDDSSNDCVQDVGEMGLANWMVKIEPGPMYAITDANGYYEAWVNNNNFTVTQIIPNTFLWDSTCPLPYEYQLDLTSGGNAPNTDFAVQADNYCADLSVDIGANFLRVCHTELFYVEYCNNGNLSESNVYIDIEFDPQLTPQSSSLPWASSNGNTYTFNIGDLEPGECGTFNMEVLVDCAASIGDVECVTATIYPPSSCAEAVDPEWDHSSVQVTGDCESDSLACFTILNTGDAGSGDMAAPSEYRIYENAILVHIGTFQLNGQEDTTICWATNGNTIQLQADQAPGHPGNSNPNDIIEDCGSGSGSNPGIVAYVGQTVDDMDPFVEIECLEVVASYDPNDKTPTPLGYDVEHFISADDLIEYKVRFQNTGSDTAFKVVLRDQIDVDRFDITTVQSGVSSHPYQFEMFGNGMLQWTFDPIALVDSATNEDASIGFVKFKIEQKPSNLPGDLLENFVDIYFDYNEPVRTDTAFNTIESLKLDLGVPYFHKESIELSVYPVPAQNWVSFELNKVPISDYQVVITDLQGRIVSLSNFSGLKTTIDVSNLTDGIYLYQLRSLKEDLASGKIIVSK